MGLAKPAFGCCLFFMPAVFAFGQSTPMPEAELKERAASFTSRPRLESVADEMTHPPIRSKRELTAYLNTHRTSPLDAFDAPARERFIESLTFSDRGLTGYRTAEIQSDLTRAQAHAILSLFGVQSTVDSLDFERDADSASTPFRPLNGDNHVLADHAKQARMAARDIESFPLILAKLQDIFSVVLKVVGDGGEENLSDQDTRDFHELATTLAFYSNDADDVRQMRRTFDEMERRGLATRTQGQAMRDQYVAARMISEAHEFEIKHSRLNLSPIPSFFDSKVQQTGPVLWRLSDDGALLTKYAFHQGSEARLVVVASPWCSFSQAAARAIASDEEVSSLMLKHSTWILPQSRIPDFTDIRAWNQQYPRQSLQIVDRNADWPTLALNEFPTFYFFRGNKVVSKIVGWPGNVQLEELRKGFSSIGLAVREPAKEERQTIGRVRFVFTAVEWAGDHAWVYCRRIRLAFLPR